MPDCPICSHPREEGDHTLCNIRFRGLVDQRLKEREAERSEAEG